MVFASRQLTVFKNESKKRNDQVENRTLKAEEEFPDYITQTRCVKSFRTNAYINFSSILQIEFGRFKKSYIR